jgi:putative restriction endonuclease
MRNSNWTREELILAFNLYCQLQFGKYHQHNPDIIKLAQFIARTPSAVAMKLSNFASFDPVHQSRGVKGLINASRADREIWEEFNNNWNKAAIESQLTLWKQGQVEIPIEQYIDASNEAAIDWNSRPSETERTVKVRLGQSFFRKTILASYRETCCVCGLPISLLLIASHIIPWEEREDLRLNPHNGLCLCAIHDKAFDKGLMSIRGNYHVEVSPTISRYMPQEALQSNFERYNRERITLPDKFLPNGDFLEYHHDTYFKVE